MRTPLWSGLDDFLNNWPILYLISVDFCSLSARKQKIRQIPMKSILVPFDFSEEAENAFQLAQDIAAKAACKLKLVHVIEIPTTQHFNTMGEVNMEENFIDKIYMVDLVEKRKSNLRSWRKRIL